MLETWIRAVTQPMLATYEELLQEEAKPSLIQASLWMALAGLIAGALQGLLGGGVIVMVCGAPLTAIVAIIAFMIGSPILYIIAKALGGSGNLDGQSYLLAAGQAPMIIIAALLSLIHPALGLLANLYTLWLNVVALQAAHRYSLVTAVITVLIPALVVAALVTCCLVTLAPAINDLYEEIQEDLNLDTLEAGVVSPSSPALQMRILTQGAVVPRGHPHAMRLFAAQLGFQH